MGRTLQIPTPKAFQPLLGPARYKGVYGGRGGAKSWFFAQLLIERCLLQRTRAVCIREFQRSLEQSVKRLLEDQIQAFHVDADFRILNTHIETPDDGIIIFAGMNTQTTESLKSLEGYHIAWVEEAQSLSQRSLDLLRPTIREEESELWFSWNPRFSTDPVDAFFRHGASPPHSILVQANYLDNPWFPDVLRQEMEYDKRTDPDKYAHVWLGGYEQHSEARVFRNFRVEEFDTPDDAVFLYGADWGFSVDPTVLVRCFIRNRTLYIDQAIYRIGVEIDLTPTFFDTLDNGRARQWPIIADSARPETISYLRRNGYPRIQAAVKGKDSVKEGVIFLQGLDILIHPRCHHAVIDEFSCYSYKVDALTGTIMPVLEDKKNHIIDSIRYATETLRHRVSSGVVESVWG